MLSLAILSQQEFRSPANDINAVTNEFFQHLPDRKYARPSTDQRQQNHADGRLQRGELVKLVQHHFFVRVPLQHDVKPNLPWRNLAVRQVNNARDAFDAVVFDKQFKLFADAVTRLHVGNFSDDNNIAFLLHFEVRSSSKCNRGTTRLISATNT